MNDAEFHPLTYRHMMEEYVRHPEAKSLGPDGKPCLAETRGLLQRAHIIAGRIRYIDKETSSMWSQSDDLSVLPDGDETGFRVIEYGKGRKVRLPDSVKDDMREIGLRKLRRRGIGQHTIEKALYAKVRVSTYRKIVAAIAEYRGPCEWCDFHSAGPVSGVQSSQKRNQDANLDVKRPDPQRR